VVGGEGSFRDRSRPAAGEPHQIRRREFHLQPALAGADHDGRELQRRRVDDRGQRLALAERADPAPHVARGPLGVRGVGHHRLAAADRSRERFEVERAAHRHDRDGQHAVHPRHQRLEDLPRVLPQR
jgi:hypothetical protein